MLKLNQMNCRHDLVQGALGLRLQPECSLQDTHSQGSMARLLLLEIAREGHGSSSSIHSKTILRYLRGVGKLAINDSKQQ